MIIIKKEKIVHGIKIVKNRDFFLQDKNRFERTEQLCVQVLTLIVSTQCRLHNLYILYCVS